MTSTIIRPVKKTLETANITAWMKRWHCETVEAFHRKTVENQDRFWAEVIKTLPIVLRTPPSSLCDLTQGPTKPNWLPHATMNIADSCFTADPARIALIYPKNQAIHTMTYQELDEKSTRIAKALRQRGVKPKDTIAIIMPMTEDAVAIYLGILKMGGIVVSIADSFSSEEISTRLRLSNTKIIFTQEEATWARKTLPLLEKINATQTTATIITVTELETQLALHANKKILDQQGNYISSPMQPINLLFSSGTTGTPKIIPWLHETPIRAASDAYFHHNIQPGDRLAWPTNLGWMMGPWLIFSSLINQATLVLYPETPMDRAFGEFIQDTKVTMLGVVPTIVSRWRATACMAGLDFSAIKCFSSTGECSNEDDMAYLMSLGGGKPIIEYCGGTEIGGAYVSSTVVQDNYPAQFSTPTMGTQFFILDENGQQAPVGEVAIVSPTIGLSTTLLNGDHEQTYFTNMPKGPNGETLRRHGDLISQLENGYYQLLGRNDDTMNLGGIKVSAVEIERALMPMPDIIEIAAIGKKIENNLTALVIYVVTNNPLDPATLKTSMQSKLSQALNPLFKIHEVILIDALPKTASNKIMRRLLARLAT